MSNFIKLSLPKRVGFSQTKNYSDSVSGNLISVLRNMPKMPKHIVEAQKQRNKIKEKLSNYLPGRITLQVLGSGAKGAPRCLYVFSDQARYLFNCGEGMQRLAHEHKMKLARLEHVFITQRTWQNIGGLPGTALTIQDVGIPKLTLHGPKGLEELFKATKRFVILKDLKIETVDCSENDVFEDNVMTVNYVPIKSSALKKEAASEILLNDNDMQEIDHMPLKVNATNDLSKSVQMEHNLMEATTSTQSARKRCQSRRSSRSCSPSIPRAQVVVEDDIDYYAHERKNQNQKAKKAARSRSHLDSGRRASPDKAADLSRLSLLKESKAESTAMCYICKLWPRPGTLNLAKCVKYGVPSGPLLGQLKKGEDITLPSGVVVKSKDVCEPDDPGPVFIVVDCPSEDFLHSFVNNPAFKRHQARAEKQENVACLVVHFTPPHVLNDLRYHAWMEQFSPNTQHLVLNESNKCLGSIAVHRVQYKLNILHNIIFPLLSDKGISIEGSEDEPTASIKRMKTENKVNVNLNSTPMLDSKLENQNIDLNTLSFSDNFIYANTFCNFHLRPKKGLDRSSELKLTPAVYVEEAMNEEGFPQAVSDLKIAIREMTAGLKIRPYPRLLFLGTGSCIPNKTRNTSGILLEVSNSTSILIDCGEGTYGQIVRFYGHDKVDEVMSKIKGIFISHLHADHHIGLIALLQGRRKALENLHLDTYNPVVLIAPKQILAWLNFYDEYFENISREFELVPNAELLQYDQTLFEGTKVRVFMTLEMSDITTAYVRHCPNAFGIAFTHKSGNKICYSGDTMPSENLINIGMNCDLLIHEATMEDELEEEALVKMHSTTSQAIEVGRNMNAKHIMLTHFSQRYAKLPRFNDNFGNNVGIAFDNMQVRLDELPLVPLFGPALKLMFADYCDVLETKALKRQLKQSRREASGSQRNPEVASASLQNNQQNRQNGGSPSDKNTQNKNRAKAH